jgi:hypothetical protein
MPATPRMLKLLLVMLIRSVLSRRDLLLENLALRQQVWALARRRPRPQFSNTERLLCVIADITKTATQIVAYRRAL